MRRQAQSAPTIALALCLAAACSPDAESGAADAAQGPVAQGDAGTDASQAERFQRAAARICREVCACTGYVSEDRGTTACYYIPESCCTHEIGYTKESGGCEYEFVQELELSARACEMRGAEDCFCESLEHCLDWIERTECPRDRAPLRNGLVVPRTCVSTNPGWSDRCCTWGETMCELLESTLAAERAGAFTPP